MLCNKKTHQKEEDKSEKEKKKQIKKKWHYPCPISQCNGVRKQ